MQRQNVLTPRKWFENNKIIINHQSNTNKIRHSKKSWIATTSLMVKWDLSNIPVLGGHFSRSWGTCWSRTPPTQLAVRDETPTRMEGAGPLSWTQCEMSPQNLSGLWCWHLWREGEDRFSVFGTRKIKTTSMIWWGKTVGNQQREVIVESTLQS